MQRVSVQVQDQKQFFKVLDIDLKIPLTCNINCMGGITGRAFDSQSKQEADSFSA